MFDYAGAFHLHSAYSFDGTTPVKDIIAAAGAAGCDFIVLTDHFRMDARDDGWEGWHNSVLVIVGEEISPRYNHYLALGLKTPVIYWKKSSRPQEYIDAVNAQGGLGLIAHPDHRGTEKFGVKSYEWNDWSATGYAGISIWDFMTDWQEKLTSLPAAFAAFFFPTARLSGPKQATLERWDRLNREGRCAGYGEVDNHNHKKIMYGKAFSIFPFTYALSTIRTHVLLDRPLSGDSAVACRQVIDAVKACRMYISLDRWRSAKGFSFVMRDGEKEYTCGDEVPFRKNLEISIALPFRARTRLLRDGMPVAQAIGTRLRYAVDRPGAYRVEAFHRKWGVFRPWIFSNPMYIR